MPGSGHCVCCSGKTVPCRTLCEGSSRGGAGPVGAVRGFCRPLLCRAQGEQYILFPIGDVCCSILLHLRGAVFRAPHWGYLLCHILHSRGAVYPARGRGCLWVHNPPVKGPWLSSFQLGVSCFQCGGILFHTLCARCTLKPHYASEYLLLRTFHAVCAAQLAPSLEDMSFCTF
jgi:hypothetical protein